MNKNPESKDSLVNHPIKILKLSVIAMIALLIIGFIILQLDSEVMGIVLMAAGVCCAWLYSGVPPSRRSVAPARSRCRIRRVIVPVPL